ncbi:hypothetical protein BSKO_11588 [Bryopsis sp. KO-2023]|nr:hypothetical protein BSKO_11588 [Bryopsis sp. KO-2023]
MAANSISVGTDNVSTDVGSNSVEAIGGGLSEALVLDTGGASGGGDGLHDPVQVNLIVVEPHENHMSESEARRIVATFYAILAVMLLAQMLLVFWKARHRRSYELVTLIGLWLIPAFYSFELKFWRFLVVWIVYSATTSFILSKCLSKTLSSTTPGLVYWWFLGVYKLSVAIGISGYALFFLEVFGMGPLIRAILPPTISIDLLWYGLYYGILGRDCAEVASDWMQSRIMGGGRRLSVQINKCGICNKELSDKFEGEAGVEKSVQLDCKHLFHETCIRGWTIVGKKDVCPTCMEKVDLKALYSDRPWETSNLSWIKMLDAVRYLVVWNPIIFVFIHFALHIFGMDKNPAATPQDPVMSNVFIQ